MNETIQHDLPIPGRGNRYEAVYALGVKDSVVLTDYLVSTLRSTITYIQKRYDRRLTVRTQPDGTIRVWRVK